MNSFLDESDADDESDVSSQSAADVTLDMIQNNSKTKSLRPRKMRKVYTDHEQSDDDVEDDEETPQVIVSKKVEEKQQLERGSEKVEEKQQPEMDPNLEPGSVLIYPSEGPDGNPVYKFFMVAPVQGEEVSLQNNAKNILNIGTVRVEENITVPAEENNITIPAEEGFQQQPNCIIQQNILIKSAVDTASVEQK